MEGISPTLRPQEQGPDNGCYMEKMLKPPWEGSWCPWTCLAMHDENDERCWWPAQGATFGHVFRDQSPWLLFGWPAATQTSNQLNSSEIGCMCQTVQKNAHRFHRTDMKDWNFSGKVLWKIMLVTWKGSRVQRRDWRLSLIITLHRGMWMAHRHHSNSRTCKISYGD